MGTPVTVAVRREITSDHVGDASEWVAAGLALARGFDGCLGGGMLRDTEHDNVLHVVYRFRDETALASWELSEERQRWLRDGDALIVDARTQRRTGIEGWFDGPQLQRSIDPQTGRIRTIGVRAAPMRWKQAVAIWLGMYPLNLLTTYAVTLLPWWGEVPFPLRSAIIVSTLVPVMTFLMMPAVTRALRPWLRRNPGAIRSERALREALSARPPRS